MTAAPTVLVCNDSPTLRRIVTSVLRGEGFAVVTAQDGVDAVQQAFRVRPDAIVLDVRMSRVSGYAAARLLKDDWRTTRIPIVVLTSLGAASDRWWSARTGTDAFLTKDFEAPELVEAVRRVLVEAQARLGGHPPQRAEPAEVADEEVLSRVCELLDRTLFEASVTADVTAIAADVQGFEQTVAAVLGVLGRVVDHDLAGVLLLEDRSTYVTVVRDCSRRQYAEFFGALAAAAGQLTGTRVGVEELVPRVADPHARLGAEDEGRMAAFRSFPLRVGGVVVGVLALSSAAADDFGEAALRTLRLVEQPAAVVIENARLSRRALV